MNDYGFSYMNYITGVPSNMNYSNMVNPNDYMVPALDVNDKNNYMDNFNIEQLYNPTIGLEKGNLFKKLYDPYKNYEALKLNPLNEKQSMMMQLMQYKFALIELQLYLDTHPRDVQILDLYNKYLDIEKKMCTTYEKKFGPITCDSENIYGDYWSWNNSPWPWEVK